MCDNGNYCLCVVATKQLGCNGLDIESKRVRTGEKMEVVEEVADEIGEFRVLVETSSIVKGVWKVEIEQIRSKLKRLCS